MRLELAYSALHKYLYRNFNSIKVRLEHIQSTRLITININFNSIKVRLEHNYLVSDDKLYVFQFHKGAIRT